jgi:hypothetical protein
MVRRFEVSHFEFDELSAIILPSTEGDWEDYYTKRVCHVTWVDAVERGLPGNQHILEIQAHFLQGTDKDEVEPASTIDNDLGELDLRHHRIQNQGELTGLRKSRPLVVAGERDGDLRPAEWSWYRRLDGHDLPKKQLLVPPGAKILVSPCCRSKPTGEQRQATRGAGRLPGLLVGPGPSVNGPRVRHTPWLGEVLGVPPDLYLIRKV